MSPAIRSESLSRLVAGTRQDTPGHDGWADVGALPSTRFERPTTSLLPPRHRQRPGADQQTSAGAVDHSLHAQPPNGAARR